MNNTQHKYILIRQRSIITAVTFT